MKVLVLVMLLMFGYSASANEVPKYKPSSRSPEPLDITTNAYGYSNTAPAALAIGDVAPDFRLPSPFGANVSLTEAAKLGPVVLIFYRGHW